MDVLEYVSVFDRHVASSGLTLCGRTTWKQVDCPPKVKKNQKILIIIICSIFGSAYPSCYYI